MSGSQHILITGGAGFIGSNLAGELIRRGHKVRVLDNLLPQIHGTDPARSPLFTNLPPEVDFVKGDVCNADDWLRALDGINCVVHLAAETGTGQSMYDVSRYFDVNVQGTAHLLDHIANHKARVNRVVIASSRAIYGEGKYVDVDGAFHFPQSRGVAAMENGQFEPLGPDGKALLSVPTTEDSAIHPSSYYGLTKQVQEQVLMLGAQAHGFSCIGLRYQNVYGPGQSLNNPYTGIISIFSKLLLTGKDINIFEDGKESRDFVHIADVVRATADAVECSETISEAMNIGSGVATTIMEVAEALTAHLRPEALINITGQFRIGDIRHNRADISKASQLLGFKPTMSFADGVSTFVDWVRTQNLSSDSGYERSLAEMQEKGLLK